MQQAWRRPRGRRLLALAFALRSGVRAQWPICSAHSITHKQLETHRAVSDASPPRPTWRQHTRFANSKRYAIYGSL